jgi:hypothetical protein
MYIFDKFMGKTPKVINISDESTDDDIDKIIEKIPSIKKNILDAYDGSDEYTISEEINTDTDTDNDIDNDEIKLNINIKYKNKNHEVQDIVIDVKLPKSILESICKMLNK